MESSSSSRRHLHTSSHTSRKSFISKRIVPAIVGKSCPICLNHIDNRRAAVLTECMHAYCIDCIRKWSNLKRKCPLCNSNFDSWFCKLSFSSGVFHRQQLPAPGKVKKVKSGDFYGRRGDQSTADQRVIRRSRQELNIVSGRTRPLPRQRSFGQSRSVLPDVIRERVLQWRASIYEQRLQAVPCSVRNFPEQCGIKNGVKERILRKIEPWIRRELQAICVDPDLSILVHVATSLFIASLEEKQKVSSGHSGVEDKYLESLRPFLLEKTSLFWHELRCFAENPFNMDTYDTVVDYIMHSN